MVIHVSLPAPMPVPGFVAMTTDPWEAWAGITPNDKVCSAPFIVPPRSRFVAAQYVSLLQ